MAGKIPRLIGETHRALEHTQDHSPRNQHQKVPICLWVVAEVTESWQRAEQGALFPLRPLPQYSVTVQGGLPWPIPKAPPLTSNRHAKAKKIRPK